MVGTNLLRLPLAALLVLLVKGMTDFGPAIVTISPGALFLLPQMVVVLGALLAGTAGLVMLWIDSIKGQVSSGYRWLSLWAQAPLSGD